MDKKPDAKKIWKQYEKGLSFNSGIDLENEVMDNENFFIGKQWENVQANGLPTPVFNFLKRVTLFTVASCTTDNLKMQATPLGNSGAKGEFYPMVRIINDEFTSLFEHNDVCGLMREAMRNAAVDGDGCTYTYWDPETETGQAAKGGIVTEVVENTRVFFGNPSDRRVERQPWIIIERREPVEDIKWRAKKAGVRGWDSIRPDDSGRQPGYSEQLNDELSTVLMYFWRDRETRHIWHCECTRELMLTQPRDMEIKRYPITWLNWDYRQDNYHGQALISGLLPNQIYINKLFAMCLLSFMTSAFPKVVYDKTRVSHWDNRVGTAIGVNGGDVMNVAKIMDPAQISPQIGEFIKLAVEYTQTFLGATPAALGDTRPDNTSAIIALQRASSTPNELTKQNLYRSIEDLGRIYLEFMGAYYGKRVVERSLPKDIPPEMASFAGIVPGQEISEIYDFGQLRDFPMVIKLDVGASAYWSEIASMQTLDNLLMQDKINLEQYLERVPDGYISMRQELLDKIRGQQAMPQQAAPQPQGGGQLLDSGQPEPVPAGPGYGSMQRELNRQVTA